MTALFEHFVANQNQPPPLSQPQVIVIFEVATSLIVFVVPIGPPCQNQMHVGYPWGMPPNYMPENFNPATEAPLVN